jgi:hypothetical protein
MGDHCQKPQVDIVLGGETYKLMMGFAEVAEFERVSKSSFLAFSQDLRIDSVIKFLSVGLRWKLGRRGASETQIAKMLDKDPKELFGIIESIGELFKQFLDDGEEKEEGDRPLPDVERVRRLSTSTGTD